MSKEKITYNGTLILEGGVRIDFYMEYKSWDDVNEWILNIENYVLPKGDFIYITEESTLQDFIIPINKVLAYCLN